MFGAKRKTRRGGASTSSTQAPATRKHSQPTMKESDVYSDLFATQDAVIKIESLCHWRECIRERGLVIRPDYLNNFGDIYNNIRQRHWEPFCKAMMTSGVQSIVREFYANAMGSRLDKVYVRKKWSPFRARAIN